MATAAAVAMVVTAAAGVGSAVIQYQRGKSVQREQKKQARIANAQEGRRRAAEIARRIAMNRAETAQVEQAAFQYGVPGGSPAVGAIGGGVSSLAGQIGMSQQQMGTQQLIAASQNRISGIQSQFDPFAAVALTSQAFTNPQANRAMASWFE